MNDHCVPGLGAIVLARFGAPTLERCLQSLRPTVRNIYVGLNPSDAVSIRTSERFGARIVPVLWSGDSAAALNPLVDAVDDEWILRLDDDMWMDSDAGQDLRPLLESQKSVAYSLLGIDLLPGGRLGYSYRQLLWRRDSGFRFRGAGHERLYSPQTNQPLGRTPRANVALYHDGYYDQTVVKEKRPRNMLMIEQELAKAPDDRYYVAYRWLTGDLAAFRDRRPEIAEWLSAEVCEGKVPLTPIADVIVLLLEAATEEKSFAGLTPSLIERIHRWYGERPRVLWALVGLYQGANKPMASQAFLVELLKAVNSEVIDFSQQMDSGIIGRRMYSALAGFSRITGFGEGRRFEFYSRLPLPECRPEFDVQLTGSSLWVQKNDLLLLAQAAEQSGLAFSSSGGEKKAFAKLLETDDDQEMHLFKDEASSWAEILGRPEALTFAWPIEKRGGYANPFTVLEGPSRLLRCSMKLSDFLQRGACEIIARKEIRYVEIRTAN